MKDSLEGLFAFAYLRISDDREGKELGVKRQKEDILKWAREHDVTIVRFFCDNDKSASTNSNDYRDDYEEMLNLLEIGPVKIVIAYTKSRLTRDPAENERQIKLARKHGVKYFYVRGQALDLQISANRKMDRIQSALDAGAAEDIQELIMRKKLADAREGRSSGGRRRYGYGALIGTNPTTGKEVRDPYQQIKEEIEVLQEGKRRTLAGESQFSIMKDWSARNIRTSLGKTWKVGPFKRTWLNESYVLFDPTGHPTDCPCLKNPETGGTRVRHDERHRAMWPAVFSRAEHEAMVAVFNGRKSYWSNAGRLKGRTYLLSGITKCGGTWSDTDRKDQICGGEMYGQGKTDYTKDGKKYVRRYACKKWERDGSRAGCCTVFRIADAVEAYVAEQVLFRFSSPEIAQQLAPSDQEERMTEVVRELAELHARREQLASEYAAGEHDKSDYQIMVTTIKNKILVAEIDKKSLLSTKARSLAVPTDGGLREAWDKAGVGWRASVVRLVVEKVVIHPGRPGGKRWPDRNGWAFDPDLVEIVWLH